MAGKRNTDQLPACDSWPYQRLLQKAAHETGVLGHGVRLFRAFPELGSKGDRHDCEKWPDIELKRSSRKDGLVRCEGLRRGFRRSGSIKELEQLATDLLKLLHLPLLRQVGAFRQPFTDRGEAPAFAVVGHTPHQNPQQAQIVTALCAPAIASVNCGIPGVDSSRGNERRGRVIPFHSTVESAGRPARG